MSCDPSTPISNEVLDAVDRALTSSVTTALTLGPKLSEPYPDDPRWSPDTRWLQPMGRRALEARTKLRAACSSVSQSADQSSWRCPDCGLMLGPSETEDWDERDQEEPDAPCPPGCPQCPYQVMMESVTVTWRPRGGSKHV